MLLPPIFVKPYPFLPVQKVPSLSHCLCHVLCNPLPQLRPAKCRYLTTISCSLLVQPCLLTNKQFRGQKSTPWGSGPVVWEAASFLAVVAEIQTKVILPTNLSGEGMRGRRKWFSYCSMDGLPQAAFLCLPRHIAKAIPVLIHVLPALLRSSYA